MNTQLDAVRNFMLAGGQSVRTSPVHQLHRREAILRLDLITEELDELREALNHPETAHFQSPIVQVDQLAALDALTDLLYVLLGTYHTLGLGSCAEAAFNEVQRSNMSKVDEVTGLCIRDDNGKILKPSTYSPPELSHILARHS